MIRRAAALLRPQLLAIAVLTLIGAWALTAGPEPFHHQAPAAPVATVAASDLRDPADAAGPLDISRVHIGQRNEHGSFVLAVHEKLPQLSKLQVHPKSVSGPGRYLCLVVGGRAVSSRALCPGGKVSHGRIRVGISRIGKSGRVRAAGGFKARLKRGSPSALRVTYELEDAGFGAGRFRWRATSGWVGPECRAGGGRAKRARGCSDRAPDSGSKKGRIHKLRASGCTAPAGKVIRNGPRSHKRVALTFDDGPSAYTKSVMKILDRYGAKGTFFEVGNLVGGDDAHLMQELIAHGHEIGNHSWAHERLPGYSSMKATTGAIEQATGFKPCTFRPPYGLFNGGTVSSAGRLGMATVIWDTDTVDYSRPGSGTIQSRATRVQRGSIVLMHDGGGPRSQTVAALPGIVKELQGRGYELVTVTELVGGHFKLTEVH